MVKRTFSQSDLEILKKLYLKISWVNQGDFLGYEIGWRKIKDYLKIFSEVWSKNALVQWNCRILESTISQVRIEISSWLLPWRYRNEKCKRWCGIFSLGLFKKYLGQSHLRFLNQLYLKINCESWLFAWWDRSKEDQNYWISYILSRNWTINRV